MKKLWLKVLKVLKTIIEIGAIIAGVIIISKVVKDALNPKKNETVEDVKDAVETIKEKVDKIEKEKEDIQKQHDKIIADKKERDEKAKKYFPEWK